MNFKGNHGQKHLAIFNNLVPLSFISSKYIPPSHKQKPYVKNLIVYRLRKLGNLRKISRISHLKVFCKKVSLIEIEHLRWLLLNLKTLA